MRIAFRTDASSQIGTGHFMRCFTLAIELKKQGAQIRFISRYLLVHLRDMLDAKGLEYVPLSMDTAQESIDELTHANWLGTSQTQDSQATVQALADHLWDWIIVDHYALDRRWESAVRASAKQLMVIDDLADRQHDCDVLLDQNFYVDMQTRYINKVPEHCQLLLGPRYALLRDEFRVMREQIKPRSGEVKNILVFFGGVDAGNYTGLALQALAGITHEEQHVDVVIGAQHPWREQIQAICATHGYVCHVQTAHMAELMAKADMSIGAGGTATWERCCLGLPTLTFCIAENQHKQVVDAAEVGLLYAPLREKSLEDLIYSHAQALMENSSLLKLISINAMRSVDGNGIQSVIKILCASQLNLQVTPNILVRKADISDAVRVWAWRNHEATRRYFFDASAVSLEAHIEWWNGSLLDYGRILLLGYFEGVDFGVIRFDVNNLRQAVISIYINPELTGQGFGRALLRQGLDWLRSHRPEINVVLAEVVPENIASLKVFQSAGFREHHRVMEMNFDEFE